MVKLKLFLSLFLLLNGINASLQAMDSENESVDIRAITPIKHGMNSEKRREAIQSFLRESLKPESELRTTEISGKQTRQCGVRMFQTYTLNDGSEWVMGQGGLSRFLGYLYLKKAIEYYGLKTLRVVETRFAYRNPSGDIEISVKPVAEKHLINIPTIDSKNFFSLSRYMGDDRPTLGEGVEELEILRTKIGFTDLAFNANLRKKDGIIYIIDTEYPSFSSTNISPYIDKDDGKAFTFSRDQY